MKYKYDFTANEYTHRVRIKPAKMQLLKDNFRILGKVSAAALLDQIVEEYFKPNLFKKKR